MKLTAFIQSLIEKNNLTGGLYAEPFAGGANVALSLLYSGHVANIVLNDIDRSIFAFWYSVLFDTDRLLSKINETSITIEEWVLQKNIQQDKCNADLLALGFSTFFLNRTNRSGVISAGVIGGKKQSGKWKMDVRFNKKDLMQRIEKIASYQTSIAIYNLDALDFVHTIAKNIDKKSLIYFDPPYYNKGSSLYVNYYSHSEHSTLASFIKGLAYNWILTYDYTPEILELFTESKKHNLFLGYSVEKKYRGQEIFVSSNNLHIPTGKFNSVRIE